MYSIYFGVSSFWCQHWERPTWDSMNRRIQETRALEKEIAGVKNWVAEERRIVGGDLSDAVDYERSSKYVSAAQTGEVYSL